MPAAAAIFPAPAQELPALNGPPRPAIPDERRVVECQPSLAAPCGCGSRSPLPHAGTRRQCDSPAVDPIPEDFTDVNEYFLPDYIRTSTGLIDPQKLLAEVESNDVIELIKLIKSATTSTCSSASSRPGRKSPLPSMLPPSPARYSGTRSATCCSISTWGILKAPRSHWIRS